MDDPPSRGYLELEQAKAGLAKLAQALNGAQAKIAELEQDRAHAARLEIEAFEAETQRIRAIGLVEKSCGWPAKTIF